MLLDQKPALVTGAARRIGLAIASSLAADGGRAGQLDPDGAAAEAAATKVGGGAMALAADVTQLSEVGSAVSRVAQEGDKLDILVNNAGISHTEVSTTIIYTHVLTRGPAGVRSPADRMFLS